MLNILRKHPWSPYAAGAAIGVLSWITFGVMGKALGASTTLVRAVGMAEGAVSEEHVRDTAYLSKYLVGKPGFEWQFAMVLFLIVGGFIAARMAKGSFAKDEPVPPTWKARFGASKGKRALGAFVGGALLLYGARMAGGCTSGHAISGGLQLAVSSWVFLAAMFGGGVLVARTLLISKEG